MADDTTTQQTVSDVPPTGAVVRPKRVSATLWDMVRSLGVLVVVIAITLLFVPQLLHPNKSQRFQSVTYADYTQGFKRVTGMDAVVPTGLAAGWYANSGALTHAGTSANLRIGWVTPAKNYLALDESNKSARLFISEVLGSRGLTVTGSERIAGATWSLRTSDQGEKSISRTVSGVTVVITGSGTSAEQSDLATALRTA